MERDLSTKLDSIAVDHHNTDNPHVHLLIRGKAEDGRDLVISRDYTSRGIRARAQDRVAVELSIARGAHLGAFSGTAWGRLLFIARFVVNLSARVSSYAHPYLSFQRNSTLQHYDAIEFIARAVENCVCMFVIVNERRNVRGVRSEFLYAQIFIVLTTARRAG
jgi:hypothetical protein